jgi:tricorn protease
MTGRRHAPTRTEEVEPPMRVPQVVLAALVVLLPRAAAPAAPPLGYYRQPALGKDTIVFVAEGDLWQVSTSGGTATRLTTHPGEETLPALSPDGQTLAFTAQYEGPTEVYTMPLAGGPPRRRTYDAGAVAFVGWTPDGQLLFSTDHDVAPQPGSRLVTLDVNGKGGRRPVPLAQAAEGAYDDTGKTLYFTRLPFQGSHTKRYQGGTAQNLWQFAEGAEARPLTAGYKGTSHRPMWWHGRVYFASDRDGTMNLWSMSADGGDLKQHTHHAGWDVLTPSLWGGRIVYQLGADIHLYDVATEQDRLVPIALDSDFDQTREHWVPKPLEYLTAAHLAPDGGRVVLTARGRVFVAPHRQGRLVEVARQEGVRYRGARFLPDGKALVALSDQSGEVELWKLPANGVGRPEQLTHDGQVLRWDAVPAPDGGRVAHTDKNQRLFVLDLEKHRDVKVDESAIDDFDDLRWSPDGKWLAYVARGDNAFRQVKLYGVADGKVTAATSDRFDSYSPAWSPDGHWLYLLSDRHLETVVEDPWGNYQPEPFLDKKTKVYQLALVRGERSPFAPADELSPEKKEDAKEPGKEGAARAEEKPVVKVDLAGIQARLVPVPVPPGNYSDLAVNDKALFCVSTLAGAKHGSLVAVAIARDNVEVKTVVEAVKGYELSQDGKKLLVQTKKKDLYVLDAVLGPADLEKKADLDKKDVDLSDWALSVQPREEWRQMFVEAWRLERDYFYDRAMHGVDWAAMRRKYEPLVERVTSRAELSDLIAQLVSELSALHIFVRGGDLRHGGDDVLPASLGAVLVRDESAGGYRVEHVYQSDPDEPERAAPLARPDVDVREGDVLELIDGTPVLSAADPAQLLRHKADRQVLLRVKPKGGGAVRDAIVRPMTMKEAAELRYHEWEYTRRLTVEKEGKGELGYVHLQAMTGDNYTEWAKGFYPVFTRKGLIVDVRNNRGGNIDSWIIGRLLRRPWFYWSQRVGASPAWNMQYAFRGHVVVLCNEHTASDGEAFTEGIKRLGIGKVIGTRTWGGEIWLSANNLLVDEGIATSAEAGVYGPEGVWLIEGHGVEPDVVVDNLPNATFKGEDAQLQAAIRTLQQQIKEKPVEVPPRPAFPNKAFKEKAVGK